MGIGSCCELALSRSVDASREVVGLAEAQMLACGYKEAIVWVVRSVQGYQSSMADSGESGVFLACYVCVRSKLFVGRLS